MAHCLMAQIFLLVGGPAVGKTTTAAALARRFPRAVHIEVDRLRHMVTSGLALPSLQWPAELVEQISLARGVAVAMAQDYRAAGFTVVIDDFWDRMGLVEYQGLAAAPETYRVLLLPAQAQAHHRSFLRAGDSPARTYIDTGIQDTYQHLLPRVPALAQSGWLVLDTSDLDVDSAVAAILAGRGSGAEARG